MKVTDKYVFFYGSVFSQWAPVGFELNGIKYNCAEQYMMASKAALFNDKGAFNAIMLLNDPADQKAWGKKVKGFKKDEWEAVAKEVVIEANFAKFSQNGDALRKIWETGDRIIVEASPTDKIWGIGLRESDPRCLDPNQWQGTNWLGECIMKVREMLRKQGYFDQFEFKV